MSQGSRDIFSYGCCKHEVAHLVATLSVPALEFDSIQPISGLFQLNKFFANFQIHPFAFGQTAFAFAFAVEVYRAIFAGITDVQEDEAALQTKKTSKNRK